MGDIGTFWGLSVTGTVFQGEIVGVGELYKAK